MVEEILSMVKKIVEIYYFFHNCFLIYIIFWGNMKVFKISWSETLEGETCVKFIEKFMEIENFEVFWKMDERETIWKTSGIKGQSESQLEGH